MVPWCWPSNRCAGRGSPGSGEGSLRFGEGSLGVSRDPPLLKLTVGGSKVTERFKSLGVAICAGGMSII